MDSENLKTEEAGTISEGRIRQLEEKSARPGNLAHTVSIWRDAAELAVIIASGVLYAAGFPPLNWSFLGWVGLVPLYWIVREKSPGRAFAYAYIWGVSWAVFSFFFLREIEFFVPFAIALVLAFFPALWAWPIPVLKRYFLVPVNVQLQGYEAECRHIARGRGGVWYWEILLVLSLASWWCVLEWIRTWLFTGFPWNLIAVTQWCNPAMLQICEYAGVYGLSFILVFFNISTAFLLSAWLRSLKGGGYRRPGPFYAGIGLVVIALMLGSSSLKKYRQLPGTTATLSAGVIQADIPQCRLATEEMAKSALNEHIRLSEMVLKLDPDILIWPETSVPEPFLSGRPLGYEYRFKVGELIKSSKTPMLIGTIDFSTPPEGIDTKNHVYRVYNSAIMLDSNVKIVAKYNKIHLVPFGEYTPFEKYFPQWIVSKFNMGRSCSAGSASTVFPLKEGIRAAVCICFEDIFPEISRNHALAGANLLVVLTNDAWYPKSSEPQQHLAHAVFRAVETRRTILRCGNNSGSCVISPAGAITDSLTVSFDEKLGRLVPDPTQKCQAYGVFKLNIPENPPLTFYTRYPGFFISLYIMVCFLSGLYVLMKWRDKKEALLKSFPSETGDTTGGPAI